MALRAAHGDESRRSVALSYFATGSGQGRSDSGLSEAVREFDLGHEAEPISVRRFAGEGSCSTKRCVKQFACPPLPAGDNNNEGQDSRNRRTQENAHRGSGA